MAKTLTPMSTTQVPRPQGVGNEIKIAIVPDAKLARTMCMELLVDKLLNGQSQGRWTYPCFTG